MGRRVPAGEAEAFRLMVLRCGIVSDIPRPSHEVKLIGYALKIGLLIPNTC